MSEWIADLAASIASAIGNAIAGAGASIAGIVWGMLIGLFYSSIYDATAEFFANMGNMGADIFDLKWVDAVVELFELFGWGLLAVGIAVAVFDFAIDYQNGRGNIRTTCLNVLKGVFAASLISTVPIALYKFCISLQNTFASDLGILASGEHAYSIAQTCSRVLVGSFQKNITQSGLFTLLMLIAFVYCIVVIFFQNIKRGGILLVQIAVGSLYMFSVPRGYTDGFVQWCKQVVALCLTAFMQTTLLYLGLITFPTSMMMGLGLMLAAKEVPRIAQQFGMDTTAQFNIMSVVHATTTAINLTRIIKK